MLVLHDAADWLGRVSGIESSRVCLTVASLIACSGVYALSKHVLLKRMKQTPPKLERAKFEIDCANRIVATAHALFAFLSAMIAIMEGKRDTSHERVYEPNAVLVAQMSASLGYFLWDSWWIYAHWENTAIFMQTVVHHILATMLCVLGMAEFMWFHATLALTFELSTVFLHLSWFLRLFDQTASNWSTRLSGALFATSFFIVRFGGGSVLAYYVLLDTVPMQKRYFLHGIKDDFHFAYFALAAQFVLFVAVALNFLWGAKIWRILKRTFSPRRPRQDAHPKQD
ncbi:MAG: hypothetical protein MHM6MM_006993 [Cercozoa sp. M6MM]